jgi:hypothetical protein
LKKKRKTRKGLKHYLVYGYIPRIDLHVHEFIQECSKQQALKIVGDRLRQRYPHTVIPPGSQYCDVIEIRPPRSSAQ